VLARAALPHIVRITPEARPPTNGGAVPSIPPVKPIDEPLQPVRFHPGLIREAISPAIRESILPAPSPVVGIVPVEPPGAAPSVQPVIAAPPSVVAPPSIRRPSLAAPPSVAAPPLLRISGVNLLRGVEPRVTIQGEAVPVLKATEKEIIVAPHAHLLSGTLAVEVEPGVMVETEFQLPRSATVAPSPLKGTTP
jgi:hypothetical protein